MNRTKANYILLLLTIILCIALIGILPPIAYFFTIPFLFVLYYLVLLEDQDLVVENGFIISKEINDYVDSKTDEEVEDLFFNLIYDANFDTERISNELKKPIEEKRKLSKLMIKWYREYESKKESIRKI